MRARLLIWGMPATVLFAFFFIAGFRLSLFHPLPARIAPRVRVIITLSTKRAAIRWPPDRGTSGREQSMSMWLSSTEPDMSLWGGKDGGGTALRTGRPTAGMAESSAACQHSLEGEDAGLDEGICLLSGPVGMIRGQPGIVRHAVLNNR